MVIHVTGHGQFPGEINLSSGKNKKGYFNTTQISMLMGNRQVTEWNSYPYSYYPTTGYLYWLSSSSIAYPSPNSRTEIQFSPSVTMTNGYRFNEHWAAGIGVGFEIFHHNLFPVFADVRYTLWDNKVSPFLGLKTGYAISSFKKKHCDGKYLDFEPYYVNNADIRNYGGFILNPEMGVKVTLSEKADFLVTVAYRHQKTKTTVKQNYGYGPHDYAYFNEWDHKASLNRLSFGIGIMFK
jgi:hypothetical protein